MKSIAFGGKEYERFEINVLGYGCGASATITMTTGFP